VAPRKAQPIRPIVKGDHYGFAVDASDGSRRLQRQFLTNKYPNPLKAALAALNAFRGVTASATVIPGPLSKRIAEYFRDAELTGTKKPETIQKQRCRLNIFGRWCASEGLESVDDLALEHIERFRQHYMDPSTSYYPPGRVQTNKKATWNKYRVNLGTFFAWCVDKNYMAFNPIAGRKKLRYGDAHAPEPRYLSVDELHTLWEWLDAHLPAPHPQFYRILYYSGLRPGEVVALRRGRDIQIPVRQLIIRNRTNTKRKRPPIVAISEKLLPVIYEALKHPGSVYLFDNGQGSPLWTVDRWYRWLIRAADSCGIVDVNLKTFRHTFASHLRQAGIKLEDIGDMLGHTDPRTTQIYSHVSADYYLPLVDQLPA
jgi:integrase